MSKRPSIFDVLIDLPYNRNVEKAEDIILDNLGNELDILKLQQIADHEGFDLSLREAKSALLRSTTWSGYVSRKGKSEYSYILIKLS